MISAAAGELGNSITTTPKSWPKSVGYTKSINRPHPELDERFQKGVADKACSKSRLGSMRAFNKANSGSIYDTGSGFINPNAGKIRAATKKSTKSKKGSKEMGQHQKQHQSTYPLGQGPVDDSSVLSFEASYTGHNHSHGDYGQYLLDEEDSLTLDGASAASPSAFPKRGAGTGDIVGGGGYKVSFDGDLYEGEHRRDRNVLAGFPPDTSVDDESKGEGKGEGHWRAKHQGSTGEQKEGGRTPPPLVLEHEHDIDEYLASRPMDTALVLGDIAVDEIYTHGDSENIADTGVGRTNTAGESPPRKPQAQAQAQAQARPHHSEMHHADFDDRSVLTDSETVHFVGGSIDVDMGHTQGRSAMRGGVQAGAAASAMARQRGGGLSNKDRVYAIDYGDHKEGIVVPGSREGGRRRGGISVGRPSSPGAADHRHYPDDGSSIATEGVDGTGGGFVGQCRGGR
jgi:hypothetical protein